MTQNPSPEPPAGLMVAKRLNVAELGSAGDLLARAFVVDPVLCHAEPDPLRRARWMGLLYRTFAVRAPLAVSIS